jgi:alkylated DNA nucleotide flippase Atl1
MSHRTLIEHPPSRPACNICGSVAVALPAKSREDGCSHTMPFDSEIARLFIAAVPAGRWTTYGDVAAVGGDHLQMAAFRVGQWLAGSEGSIDNYWRVIDVDGRVRDSRAAASGRAPPTRPTTGCAVKASVSTRSAEPTRDSGSILGTGSTTPSRRGPRRPQPETLTTGVFHRRLSALRHPAACGSHRCRS